MQRALIFIIFSNCLHPTIGQTNFWIGGVGSWSVNGNWSLGHVLTLLEIAWINSASDQVVLLESDNMKGLDKPKFSLFALSQSFSFLYQRNAIKSP